MSEPAAPKLKPHHGYRSWTSTWHDGPTRRTKRFGREGELTRAQALQRFKSWLLMEYQPLAESDATLTVDRLCDLYEEHARLAFSGSAHLATVLAAMKALKALAVGQLAATYKAHDLAKVRDAMIWKVFGKKRVARSIKTVNGRLYAIKQMFVWAATEKGLIPEGTAGAMLLVKPLKRGRCEAKDPKPIRPAKWSDVQEAMNVSPKVLRDMIELQSLTGMRSGELVMMRPCDIDADHRYTPTASSTRQAHKMEHTGQQRVIPLGPKAWRIVSKYLAGRASDAFLFSPKESVEQMLAAKSKARKTAMIFGNHRGTNVKRHAFIKPGDHYTTSSYRRAIRYACTRAGVPRWHPHQVRHAFATKVRETFNFEAASDALGHAAPDATKIYAERSLKQAERVARKIG